MEEKNCPEERPETIEACDVTSCHVDWVVSEWSTVKNLSIYFKHDNGHMRRFICNTSPFQCQCSETCGYGIQRRTVTCGEGGLLNMGRCKGDKPTYIRLCRLQVCTGALCNQEINSHLQQRKKMLNPHSFFRFDLRRWSARPAQHDG